MYISPRGLPTYDHTPRSVYDRWLRKQQSYYPYGGNPDYVDVSSDNDIVFNLDETAEARAIYDRLREQFLGHTLSTNENAIRVDPTTGRALTMQELQQQWEPSLGKFTPRSVFSYNDSMKGDYRYYDYLNEAGRKRLYGDPGYLRDVFRRTPVPTQLGGILTPDRIRELPGGQAEIGAISAYDLNRLDSAHRDALGSFTMGGGEELEDYITRSLRNNVGTQRGFSRGFASPRSYYG